MVAAQKLKRQWIGIDISPTACRVMAKRVLHLPQKASVLHLAFQTGQKRSKTAFFTQNRGFLAISSLEIADF
jgi:DNA modification methylase